jgi:hypothetical protein
MPVKHEPLFHPSRAKRHGTLLVLVLAIATAASAATWDTGERLPAVTFTDQFDEEHDLADCNGLVMFAPDRDSAEIVTSVMATADARRPDGQALCYVTDISGMPALITKMFALPAMRDYGYPVMLGRDAEATAMMPRRNGEVTLVTTRDGIVQQISYAADAQALRQALATAD